MTIEFFKFPRNVASKVLPAEILKLQSFVARAKSFSGSFYTSFVLRLHQLTDCISRFARTSRPCKSKISYVSKGSITLWYLFIFLLHFWELVILKGDLYNPRQHPTSRIELLRLRAYSPETLRIVRFSLAYLYRIQSYDSRSRIVFSLFGVPLRFCVLFSQTVLC